jgi:predicted nucleic acid-binding Zn ribbon protein
VSVRLSSIGQAEAEVKRPEKRTTDEENDRRIIKKNKKKKRVFLLVFSIAFAFAWLSSF